ncbi:MAG: anti-sigma F factor [Firmicutes bacterium]|nr:anti-sigma F factor [Bacillota bacterium]
MTNDKEIRTHNFEIEFDSCSRNEAFARGVIIAFLSELDPILEDLIEVKTAVSEAVSNCIIHAYRKSDGRIHMLCDVSDDGYLTITIKDNGVGIENVEKAMLPLFTTGGTERSGMGFTVMETFMDSVTVTSNPGEGTEVVMTKKLDVGYV